MRQQHRLSAVLVSILMGSALSPAAAQSTERVSINSAGAEADGSSFIGFSPFLSGDGERVVFASYATNLAHGGLNGAPHIYLRERSLGRTRLVTAAPGGGPANAGGDDATLSNNGRFVAFASGATNLLAVPDTNNRVDIYVRDLDTDSTFVASIAPTGAQSNGNGYAPSLSGDGRFVAFSSDATNLVPGSALSGGSVNDEYDIFVRDNRTGAVELASMTASGVKGNHLSVGPALSSDGRWVAFSSFATNLAPGDSLGSLDVFLKDRVSGLLLCVSVDPSGVPGSGDSGDVSLSGDGRWIVFTSDSSNLVVGDANQFRDVFLRDRRQGTTTRLSLGWSGAEGDEDSLLAMITPSGRFVSFASSATNLVPGDLNAAADVFVLDRASGLIELASLSFSGAQGNAISAWPSVSNDGRVVATESGAWNLVPQDTNGATDIFVHELP